MRDSRGYSTRDIVVVAVLSAVSAVAYAGLAQVWTALTAAFGPLGGAALGLFQFGHLLAFVVLRKPGVALFTSVLTTVGQLLIGDPAGAYVLGWGVIHGLVAEGVFSLNRYREPSILVVGVAGGLAAVAGQFYTLQLFGWEGVMRMFYLSLPILFVATAVESGGLAVLAGRAYHRSNLSGAEM